MAGFDYSKYFGPIGPLADVLREGEERFWVTNTSEAPGPHEYVLYLGCNVLRTTHIAETVVAVLETLGVDFVTLGGPANCCGIIHHNNGDFTISERLSRQTLGKMASYQPKAVITWCPSCHFHMDRVIPKVVPFDIPYVHITEFIADRLDRLAFRNRVERRVALHAHDQAEQQRKDAAACRAILERIPGLEIVEIAGLEQWGRHCSSNWVKSIGKERFEQLAGSLFTGARQAGVDALVTVYHSCHRELAAKEAVYGIEVVNYMSLMAEALGLPVLEDRFKRFKISGDVGAIVDELRDVAARRGVPAAKLEAVVRSQFGRPAAAQPARSGGQAAAAGNRVIDESGQQGRSNG